MSDEKTQAERDAAVIAEFYEAWEIVCAPFCDNGLPQMGLESWSKAGDIVSLRQDEYNEATHRQIDTLTARAEAAEAERDRLREALDGVDHMLGAAASIAEEAGWPANDIAFRAKAAAIRALIGGAE